MKFSMNFIRYGISHLGGVPMESDRQRREGGTPVRHKRFDFFMFHCLVLLPFTHQFSTIVLVEVRCCNDEVSFVHSGSPRNLTPAVSGRRSKRILSLSFQSTNGRRSRARRLLGVRR